MGELGNLPASSLAGQQWPGVCLCSCKLMQARACKKAGAPLPLERLTRRLLGVPLVLGCLLGSPLQGLSPLLCRLALAELLVVSPACQQAEAAA